jgi:hypothetical protein
MYKGDAVARSLPAMLAAWPPGDYDVAADNLAGRTGVAECGGGGRQRSWQADDSLTNADDGGSCDGYNEAGRAAGTG